MQREIQCVVAIFANSFLFVHADVGKALGISTATIRHRLLGYPLPIWFAPQVQGAIAYFVSTIAQLLAVICLIICILGCMAPG